MPENTREPERVQLVGGPRDGDWVPYYGPAFEEPIPRSVGGFRVAEAWEGRLCPSVELHVRRYYLHWWRTDAGDLVPRYVLDDQARGLGAR